MTFQSLEFTNKRPFKDCLIHGLIRDKDGRKMSKSLGNGVDPMDVIDNYGADALRFFLTTSTAPGLDLRYDEEKVRSTWNFINKLWNASRFCLMNIEDLTVENYNLSNLLDQDKWIISKLNKLIKSLRKSLDNYEFNNFGSEIYSFVWNDFCDSYIEMAKFNLNSNSTKSVLYYLLLNIVKLLSPFMPYVTEEIYSKLPFKDENSIMISDYPKFDKNLIFDSEEIKIENIRSFVTLCRNYKVENKIGNDALVMVSDSSDYELIIKLLKMTNNIVNEEPTIKKYNVADSYYSINLYYEKEETEEEIKLRENNIKKLQDSIERRKKLLSNENYVNKAPSSLVLEERKKLSEEETKLEKMLKKCD